MREVVIMHKKIICLFLVLLMLLSITGCSNPSKKLVGSNTENSIILLQYNDKNTQGNVPIIDAPANYVLMSKENLVYAVLNTSKEIIGYKKAVLDEELGQYEFKDCDANGVISNDVAQLRSIKFSKETYEIMVESTLGLPLIVEPLEYKITNQTWSSGDEAIATVNETGIVTAISVGTTQIKVVVDGIEATCTVNVVAKPVEPIKTTEITISKDNIKLHPDKSETLTATVKPEDAANKDVTWTSSDTSVATVVNGTVTAHKVGTATITATASGGQTATCKVTVEKKEEQKPPEPTEPKPTEPKEIKTTGISVSNSALTLDIGDAKTITATVSPSNATNKSVKWSTSDSSVATVKDGKITAVNAGTATITATASGGQTATCKVTVKSKVQSFSWEKISQSDCPLTISSNFDEYILSSSAKNLAYSKGGYTYVMLKASGTNKISVVSVTEVNGKITIKYSNSGSSNYVFIKFNRENTNITYTN